MDWMEFTFIVAFDFWFVLVWTGIMNRRISFELINKARNVITMTIQLKYYGGNDTKI